MPKLYAVRWPVGILVGLLVLAGISFATAGLRPSSLSGRPPGDAAPLDANEFAGERQELLFMKAALGRIDDELRHRGDAATPSLRGEREAVMRRIREIGFRVPPDRLPPDIAGLLRTAAIPTPAEPAVRASERPVPAPATAIRELLTGLGTRPAVLDLSSLAIDRQAPLPVFVEKPARRVEHAREAEPSDRTADRPAKEHPAKERPVAERPATVRVPATDRRQAVERPVAERAVTERPMAADQSEKRQPAR